MCGLAGIVSWSKPPDRTIVGRMARRLRHRGPDAEGIIEQGPIVLGHRRLSVIDISTAANQPMWDGENRYVIVYNGEIYNFREIRRTLESKGVIFQTASDTEVILESYKRWGTACLSRFNGMFAFAIWDVKAESLFIARDRLGKKPFYYRLLSSGGIAFASEQKAFLEDPGFSAELNPRALSHFLSLSYVLTSESAFLGVHKLPPAHYMVVERNKPLSPKKYWSLIPHFLEKKQHINVNEAAEELKEIIDNAVRIRLVSDVPLGAFLSGGLDSAAIVSSMQKAETDNNVRTFSVGFKDPSFDERPEARGTARALQTRHEDDVITVDIESMLPKICYFADEPFGDASIIPTFALSEMSRRHVTVSLSGDGADELFAGYNTYVADKMHRYTSLIPDWAMAFGDHFANAILPTSYNKMSFDYRFRQFIQGHKKDAVGAHFTWRQIFSEDEKRNILKPEYTDAVLGTDPLEDFRQFAAEAKECDDLDKMIYIDMKTWLADDILVKVDRASMAHGLEVRVPYLDHRLVEFAASIPSKLKLRGLQGKFLLRHSQRSRLPLRVVESKKRGFNAPIARWMAEPGRGLFRNLDVRALAGEWFKEEAVRELCEEHWSKCRDNSFKLFALVSLHYWWNSRRTAE